jgi:GNAT superfamily N-acetyltransferase
MTVRDARRSDLAAIEAMVKEHGAYEGSPEQVRFTAQSAAEPFFGSNPSVWALIAHPDDDADAHAGFAMWYPTFSSWAGVPGIWLEDLFVRPAFRRHGLGRELLMALRERTSGRIEWDVNETNDSAKQFYAQLGAEPVVGWSHYRWVS